MTSQERVWFDKLSDEHANDARTFAKPEYRGIWNSVIDKYSDNAHFVYELLQNADDAGATEASFTLSYGVGIFFEHNGTKHFTISNPNTSEDDQRNGRLGCVNAISAIGQSAKIVEEGVGNQIGKFGIGFKSVFRYTDTPKIYDDNVCFELRDRIVPCLIEDVPNLRKPGRTLFILHFRPQADVLTVSKEIEDSILKLRSPLLFLNNLKCISCQSVQGKVQRGRSVYRKEEFAEEVVVLPYRENVQTRRISLTAECGGVTSIEDVRTMSRVNSDGRKYVVGFRIDANGRPIPTRQSTKAFCFFQTDVDTWLNFFVHAPFRLVDNRQGLVDDCYNRGLVNKLAKLASDAVLVFKKFEVLDDSIFRLFPCDLIRSKRVRMFEDFAKPFEAVVAGESIFRTESGYADLEHAEWPGSKDVLRLLPTDVMRDLCGKDEEWIFEEHTADLVDDVTCCIKKWIPKDGSLSLSKVVNALTANFVMKRGFAWTNDLYGLILKNPSLAASAKIAPIIFDSKGNVTSAKNGKGESAIYLPIGVDCEFPTVHPDLLKQSNAESFFKLVGLRQPSRMDAIGKIIVNKIPNANGRDEYKRLFKQVLDYYVEQKSDERQAIIKLLRENLCLAVMKFDDWGGEVGFELARNEDNFNVYFPSNELKQYFQGMPKTNARCVAWDCYVSMTENGEVVDSLLSQIGVLKKVKVWSGNGGQLFINCCMANLTRIVDLPVNDQKCLSFVMWDVLRGVIGSRCSEGTPFLNLMTYSDSGKKVVSKTLSLLRATRWLVNNKGKIVAPNEVWREDLAAEYEPTTWQSIQIIEALQIKRNPQLVAIETLTDENRAALDLGQKLRAAGFDEKVSAGVSAEKLGLLLQLEEKFTEEEIKSLLNGGAEAKGSHLNVAGGIEISTIARSEREDAAIALTDNRMAGLSEEERHMALVEAKKQVAHQLQQEGFQFTKGICEENCGTINGVVKDGVEYPIVVHSYIDKSRPFQLTTEDWCQLLKPNAKLLVRTSDGICSVPFQNLVCNREKIEFSFSTKGNLEAKNRFEELAHVMRWFKGFHFDFGSLIPMEVGTAKMFDLPENQLSEADKVVQMKPDAEQEVF